MPFSSGIHGFESIANDFRRRSQVLNYATRHLLHPAFPFVSQHDHMLIGSCLLGSQQIEMLSFSTFAQATSAAAGIVFAQIKWPRLAGDNLQPLQIWRYLSDMISILTRYTSGGAAYMSPSLIVDHMGFVQHCLLSLPTQKELQSRPRSRSSSGSNCPVDTGTSEKEVQVYEIARLACLAFSHLVTYPTSAVTFPRFHLTKSLLGALRSYHIAHSFSGNLTPPEAQLAFWASVIAAVVATGLETRGPLAAKVGMWARHPMVSLRDWIGAEELVEKFLWHAYTSDADALDLWMEVDGLEREA
jgi:hypothetical protein